MYARITTYQMRPEKMQEAGELTEQLRPEIMALPGIKFWFNVGNPDGSCATIAIYDSRESAKAATDAARGLFGRFSEYLASDLNPQGYEVLAQDSNA